MYPEVEQFAAALAAAEEAASAAYVAARAAFLFARKAAGVGGHAHEGACAACAFEKGAGGLEREGSIGVAHEAYRSARADAWGALALSGDPLVAWIAKNVGDAHVDEALVVLRALPASMEELDALAARHDWCGVWERYRAQAEADGVLSAAKTSEVSA